MTAEGIRKPQVKHCQGFRRKNQPCMAVDLVAGTGFCVLHLPTPPSPHEVAVMLAEVQIIMGECQSMVGKVLRGYHAEYESAFGGFVGGSIVQFGSKGVDSGDNVGSAALGRSHARVSCSNAGESVRLARGRVRDLRSQLRQAITSLEPKMPTNKAGRAEVSDA